MFIVVSLGKMAGAFILGESSGCVGRGGMDRMVGMAVGYPPEKGAISFIISWNFSS